MVAEPGRLGWWRSLVAKALQEFLPTTDHRPWNLASSPNAEEGTHRWIMQAIRDCPACNSAEVPPLVLRLGVSESKEFSWRCPLGQYEWFDTYLFKGSDGDRPHSGLSHSTQKW
jgi:hypothetical protein